MKIKTTHLIFSGIILSLCLMVTGANAQVATGSLKGDPAAGKLKSTTCGACHGPTGNSSAPTWPKLAGQNTRYLVKQMHDFKKGKKGGRYDPSMTPMMQALSPQDMANLAAFYSAQKPTLGAADKKHLKLGGLIYRGGNLKTNVTACMACHGPSGKGNHSAGFPALSGQQAAYTEKQLRGFKSGERTNSPNQIMEQIAARMNEKEIVAVSNYIQGLH